MLLEREVDLPEREERILGSVRPPFFLFFLRLQRLTPLWSLSRSEDYRWPLVRNKIPTWAFKLLNFVFIAWIQNILLMVAELPQYLLLTHSLSSSGHISQLKKLTSSHATSVRVPLNVADVLLAAAFLTTLVFEMRADNQQQRFQNLKHGALKKDPSRRTEKEKKAIERGFVTGGLWSWSRHPVRTRITVS